MSEIEKKKVLAWYFANESRKLRYGDNREIVVGKSHRVNGKPKLCEHGLHGSVKILDALRYAPGPVVYRVELSGNMDIGDDKIAATCRKYIAGGVDITDTLREFARKQALSVAHLWNMPAVVREYLETGDESKRAEAYSAAYSAACLAAHSADWSAACLAVHSASHAAANSAAYSAACSAARSAASSADWSAAWSADWLGANDMLESMVTARLEATE